LAFTVLDAIDSYTIYDYTCTYVVHVSLTTQVECLTIFIFVQDGKDGMEAESSSRAVESGHEGPIDGEKIFPPPY